LYDARCVASSMNTLQAALDLTTRMRGHTLSVGLLMGATSSHLLKTVMVRMEFF